MKSRYRQIGMLWAFLTLLLAFLLFQKEVSAQLYSSVISSKETSTNKNEFLKGLFEKGKLTQEEYDLELGKLAEPTELPLSSLELKLQPLMVGGLSRDSARSLLRQFGYEQLRADRLAYDPISNPAPPAGYRLGPGDVVAVYSISEPQLVRVRIAPDGKLRHPQMNPIQVSNQTFEVVQKQVQQENRFMELVLEELRSIQVNIIGEARNPGLHRVPATANVAQVLSLSGGVRRSGSLRNIEWRRNQEVLTKIDLYGYLLKGLTPAESHLRSGDTLFIPLLKNAVAVAGAVWRPGIYELKEENSLGEVVELSGGFQPDSMQDCIILERLNSLGKELKPILHHPDFLRTPIHNFDVIKVYTNGSIMPKYFCPKAGDQNVVSQAD